MLLRISSGSTHTYMHSRYILMYKLQLALYTHQCLPLLPSYFSQTVHLMKEDSSLYCISAWNDQVSDQSHDQSCDQSCDPRV